MVNLFSWVANGQFIKGLGAILLSLALVSCADTDGPPEDLIGTAATGAAIAGTVYAMDAAGVEISKVINADGYFRLDVRGMTAPFILKSVADNGSELFSYAVGTDVTANITPLTNLAMYIANGEADLGILYNSWASSYVNIDVVDIKNAQAVINANLSTQYTAFSLDPFTYDIFGTGFSANGTSLDALLDAITVNLVPIDISVVAVTMPLFDSGISTVDYDIGGDTIATPGAYTLTMNVSVDGGATSSDLRLSINLPASSVPIPGSTQIVEDTFSTFYGSVGTIVINLVTVDEISVPQVTVINATKGGVPYVATYTYTLNP